MEKGLICFIVVGRMGESLTWSKAEPFTVHPSIQKIYIFRETKGPPLVKVEYVTLPRWIIKVKPRSLSKFIRIITEPVQLISYSFKFKPDLINGYHIIPKGLNSFIASKISGAKCIMSIIGGIVEIETYSRFKWLLKRINLFALRRSDLITTKGTVVTSWLKEHNVDPSKIVTYNGAINLEKYYYNSSICKDIDVIFIGTFRNLKGPDRVLKMIASLKPLIPDIKGCLIGEGYLLEPCKILARELGISDNVIFTGYVEEPVLFYQRSKVYVLPSRSEGLPTSMLEAMSCGCVPVVSNAGNIKDAAVDGKNAFIIDDYRDIGTFTDYIRLLLTDVHLRNSMLSDGSDTVLKNYSTREQFKIVKYIIQKLFA